jgi:hypothetical protein
LNPFGIKSWNYFPPISITRMCKRSLRLYLSQNKVTPTSLVTFLLTHYSTIIYYLSPRAAIPTRCGLRRRTVTRTQATNRIKSCDSFHSSAHVTYNRNKKLWQFS